MAKEKMKSTVVVYLYDFMNTQPFKTITLGLYYITIMKAMLVNIWDCDYITIISLIKFDYECGNDYSIFVIDYNRLQLRDQDYSKSAVDTIFCHEKWNTIHEMTNNNTHKKIKNKPPEMRLTIQL